MESKEAVFLSSILHLPAGISVISVHPSVTEFVVRIACQAPSMPCPECHQPSTHLHGMYQRTVADLPCAGRNVLLILRVRKFFCRTLTCSHKIFAERLPGLVESYGRMTTRLIALLQALGLGSGGQLGTRQAERSGIATTPSTLLRQVMQLPAPVTRAVRVLGVGDWSWKKHHRYGTLLVDLERHKIIDLLADRESATLERWLRDHPEVEIVSRDRGKDYAKAVTHAAPQAIQVVDRFHLVRNLSEALQKVLAHCRTEIRQQDTEGLLPDREAEEQDRPLPTPATWQQRTPPHIEIAHQARQASRDDWFRQMAALRAHGLAQMEIANRMGMSERAVRTWLKRGTAPTWKRQFRRRSVFDPYAAYVLRRWQEGVHEGKKLYEEIRVQGFPGTVRIVQRFVQALVDEPKATALPPAQPSDRFSANNATWLFIRKPQQLKSEEQAELELICQRSQTAQKAYELTQQFMSMLRQRRGQDFETWVEAVEAGHIPELKRFVQSLLINTSLLSNEPNFSS